VLGEHFGAYKQMKAEQIYEIVRKALEEGVSLDLLSLVLLGLLALLGGFLGSYLRAKGKNLATKEDTREITRKVESVKAEYARHMELLAQKHRLFLQREERKHDLSLAALDKRLAAHQEAYALWWELMGSASKKEKVGEIVMKCQEWWVNNCLYLAPDVREAFRDSYHAAFLHSDLLYAREDASVIRDNFSRIRQAGQVIVKAVALPSWGDQEYKPLEKPERNGG